VNPQGLEDATSKNEDRIKELAGPFLDAGEHVVAATTAAPRGKQTAMAGGAAGMIGGAWAGKNRKAGEAAGIGVASNMAVVITDSRLLTLETKISAMGAVSEIKGLLSALPLSEVDSIEVKRFGLAGVMSLTAHGSDPVKLEGKVGNMKPIADAFAGAQTPA
jgi:hypothetical protein